MFEFYWRQKQQEAEAHYIGNTQLHEDNQLEEEHPDVCDEASEERTESIFSVASEWWLQKKKKN